MSLAPLLFAVAETVTKQSLSSTKLPPDTDSRFRHDRIQPEREKLTRIAKPRRPNPKHVRVVHETETGDERVLAETVAVADSLLAKARGLMFRRSIPDDYALVFPFDDVAKRDTHMLFVPFPIDALWLVDGRVEATKRLAAWRGLAYERADTLIELPAGAADGVVVGDRVTVEGLTRDGE
jgi:uncharacterized membrane protein (UPF0127 family)